MVSGDLQFMQEPVFAQGVSSPNRWAFMGAATLRARFIAASTSQHTLFMPTMNITYFGPCAIIDTRLELPSIFTITPSSVIALALDKKKSAS